MKIGYLDGPRLRRSLIAACQHAQAQRQELNRINVFPVPDGDTGTNLALTVRAIADDLREHATTGVGGVAERAAQASVLGARGNCGMMLSHFLIGFANGLADRERVSVEEFALAMDAGVRQVEAAIDRPVEGTILTVMRDTAEAAVAAAASSRDFEVVLRDLLEVARDSLARTPDLLPVLRRAGVVDAGAKGFVVMIEGIVGLVEGTSPPEAGGADPRGPGERTAAGAGDASEPAVAAVAAIEFRADEQYRFCTEALVRGRDLPDADDVRRRLGSLGDSVLVIRSGDVLKVHVHTDAPEDVFAYLRRFGALAAHKAEDMQAQHDLIERGAGGHLTLARRPLSVVTDSAADLPADVIRAHGIHVVPLTLMDGERAYRDRIDMTAAEFTARLERPGPLPTTSQPPPGAYLEAYGSAAEDAEEVLVVSLGGSLSGTLGSAEAAARMFEAAPVTVFDTRAASSLQALLALRAAELGELGWSAERVTAELGRLRERSGILFTVDRFDRLLASGRVGRGRAWLGTLLGIKPVLGLTPVGRVAPMGRAIGRSRVLATVMNLLDRSVPAGASRVRFALAHVGCEPLMAEVSAALETRFGAVDIYVTPVTPVIATHVGLGAWAVAYMAE